MTDPYTGGQALAKMLFGKADPDVALDTEHKVYRNASALEQAREDQARRVARDGLPDAIDAQPNLLPHQRQLLRSTLGMASGQPNVKMGVDGLGALLDLDTRGQRAAALEAGDEPKYNRLTALETDKPFQPTVAIGGAYMENGANVMLGDEYIPTLPTMTAQQRADASISQGERRTDATVAAKARTGNSGGKPKPAKPSDALLQQARDAIAAGADVKAVKKRLQERGYSKLAKEL